MAHGNEVEDLLLALGLTTEWQAVCKPLGCKATALLNPLHKCPPTGPWTPAPIGAT